MGLAASQTRFLSLQNRKSTVGTNLSILSNRKMALNREMKVFTAQYNDALSQKQLKFSTDSGATYSNLSYNLLMKQNANNGSVPYLITDTNGKVVLDNEKLTDADGKTLSVSYKDIAEIISKYSGSNTSYSSSSGVTTTGLVSGNASSIEYKIPTSVDDFDENSSLRLDLMQKLNIITGEQATQITTALTQLYGSPKSKAELTYPATSLMGKYEAAENAYYAEAASGDTTKVKQLETAMNTAKTNVTTKETSVNELLAKINTKQMSYYDAIFEKIAENGWVYDDKVNSGNNSNSQKYLEGMLENTMYYVTEVNPTKDNKFEYTNKIAKDVSNIFQVTDSDVDSITESDYEAEKTLISSKEKDIDTKMQSLETEQSAIKTELESLKKVMNDNISSTFKMDM